VSENACLEPLVHSESSAAVPGVIEISESLAVVVEVLYLEKVLAHSTDFVGPSYVKLGFFYSLGASFGPICVEFVVKTLA
jgi:hypothetical protein